MICKKIHVRGRVQGVGFRYATRNQANALGLWGFVRNLPDGTVYIEIQGELLAVEKFIQWCHQGPPLAKVDEILVSDIPEGNFSPLFEIR